MMKDKYSKNSGGFLPKNVCGLCCLLLLWLMSSLVAHTAEVGGPISTDTTWAVADSPFNMTASVLVNSGSTLTIEAGSVINIGSDLGIQIGGTLVARGTSSQPIVFQPTSGTTPGSWGSIGFSNSSVDAVLTSGSYTSGSVLQHCQIKYGGGGGAVGMIAITSASPLIDNCQIQYADTTGIYVENTADLLIQNCLISDNSASGSYAQGGGLHFKFGTCTLTGNVISDNSASGSYAQGGAIYGDYVQTFNLSSNTITTNTSNVSKGSAIYIYRFSSDYARKIEENLITGNYSTSTNNSSAIYLNENDFDSFTKNTIRDNNTTYDLEVGFSSGKSLIATGNDWGSTDTNTILGKIYDFFDNSAKGDVDFGSPLSQPDEGVPPLSPTGLAATAVHHHHQSVMSCQFQSLTAHAADPDSNLIITLTTEGLFQFR